MKKWLVIDDDIGDQSLISLMVRKRDVEINKCYTAEDALIKVKDNSYDLIIVDLALPKMSGLEFIKTVADKIKCPIYIMSGYLNHPEISKELANSTIKISGIISKDKMADNIGMLFDG